VVPQALDYTISFFKRRSDPDAISTIHEKIAYMDARTRSIWWIERLDIDNPGIAHGVIVTCNTDQPGFREEIAASRAEWMDQAWWFFGYVSEITDDDDQLISRSRPRELPVERRDIRTRPDDLVNGDIRPPDLLNTLELHRYISTRPYLADRDLARHRVQLHQRLASPWTCLVVLLFAIPAGARTGRSGAMLGIILALSALFGYYALLQIGMFMGIQSLIPSWAAAWLPNIVFTGVGASMSSRMM
jgi:lipopolysaccharide export system permease protein